MVVLQDKRLHILVYYSTIYVKIDGFVAKTDGVIKLLLKHILYVLIYNGNYYYYTIICIIVNTFYLISNFSHFDNLSHNLI